MAKTNPDVKKQARIEEVGRHDNPRIDGEGRGIDLTAPQGDTTIG
jgi:hypothetical protein